MNPYQNNEQWNDDRLGKITASCFGMVLAKGEGKTRLGYMRTLIADMMTGEHKNYTNKSMDNGHESEPLAIKHYELTKCKEIKLVGFIPHPIALMV